MRHFFFFFAFLFSTVCSFANEWALVPPFEKIYVTPSEILMTPEGTFYRSPLTGECDPIRAVRRDCNGLYVLKVWMQCPVCGNYCTGKKPPEGYECPLWEIEAFPHIWVDPCSQESSKISAP